MCAQKTRMKVTLWVLGVTWVALTMGGCGPGPTPAPVPEKGDQAMAFELTSSAFAAGESIPVKYTCDGDDISPPLAWGDPPQGTQSFALINDDPDAPVGTWDHWILYNLPAEARSLPEGVPPDAELADGSRHGQNSWRRLGYGGPCPPSGTHRYFFKLYALDTTLDLAPGANKKRLLQAMEGHILGQAELMGVYRRK
ncbi:MAG: YbhB/YbcL family Raf kinase inhibitor-like protein [Anaerolineae bacterium]